MILFLKPIHFGEKTCKNPSRVCLVSYPEDQLELAAAARQPIKSDVVSKNTHYIASFGLYDIFRIDSIPVSTRATQCSPGMEIRMRLPPLWASTTPK